MCNLPTNFNIVHLFDFFTCIISRSIIPLIFALAIAAFVWGVVNFFIIGADEEAKRSQGKQFMIWGIIALAVMLSVWGLVRILGRTFNLNTQVIPGIRPSGSSVVDPNDPPEEDLVGDGDYNIIVPPLGGGDDIYYPDR